MRTGRISRGVARANATPDVEVADLAHLEEVTIGGQEGEFVPEAQPCEKCVDGSDLDADPAAAVAQLSGCNVIRPVRHEVGKCGETVDDGVPSPWTGKALEQLLEHETRGEEVITSP